MEKILVNKELCLKHFETFIQRDWCGINYNEKYDDFVTFEAKHSYAIFKPLNLCGGKGITIKKLSDIPNGAYEFCHSNNNIMEEIIEQDESLNTLFSGCINTIRIVTLNGKIIAAILRIGRKNSCVDNLSKGGIAAAIDIDSGIVFTVGRTFQDEEFVLHPDSKQPIPGFLIPKWSECVDYVMDAVKLCPGIPCIGWDIAITNSGPTIVEVNEGTEIEALELPLGKGLRSMFV